MKSAILVMFLLLGSFQSSVPPQKISNAFNKKFPSAINIDWQKQVLYNSEYWKASFILGGKKATATYSTDEMWLETTLEISGKELNETVKSSIMDDYPKCEILSAIINESAIYTWYEVKIKYRNKVLKVDYDYQGMPWPPRI